MYDCNGYRLPTGPEWEYAAKAGTTTNTYNGDMTDDHELNCEDEPILNDIAWYCFNTGAGGSDWHPDQIREVGLKQPNPWGLYDMLGNAGEWTDYVGTGFSLQSNEGSAEEVLIDPMGADETEDGRGDVRGGSVHSQPCYVRPARQFDETRKGRLSVFGFRPVRTLPATAPDGGTSDAGGK
jgi:formylglycine-generating enzyme required for sulfatase activity